MNTIIETQRILSRMSPAFNPSGKGRRPGEMARRQILDRWENPPRIGRPPLGFYGEKLQLKFEL